MRVNAKGGSGSGAVLSTVPRASIFAATTPMAGGAARPHVYSVPSRGSFFACALNPIGSFSPSNACGPIVSSVSRSISIGPPPSHSAKSFPACAIGAVLPGLVGNRPRFWRGEEACVHAPRTAIRSGAPEPSWATKRSVRTILAPAETRPSSPKAKAKIWPSPSNQCAYRVAPTRHRPGPTRYSVPRRSLGISPVMASGGMGANGRSPQGSRPPRQGQRSTAARTSAGGARGPEAGRGTRTACGPRAADATGGVEARRERRGERRPDPRDPTRNARGTRGGRVDEAADAIPGRSRGRSRRRGSLGNRRRDVREGGVGGEVAETREPRATASARAGGRAVARERRGARRVHASDGPGRPRRGPLAIARAGSRVVASDVARPKPRRFRARIRASG